jgi:hypothetical protein
LPQAFQRLLRIIEAHGFISRRLEISGEHPQKQEVIVHQCNALGRPADRFHVSSAHCVDA